MDFAPSVEPPVTESTVTVEPKLGCGLIPKLDPVGAVLPNDDFVAAEPNGDAALAFIPPNGDDEVFEAPIAPKGEALVALDPNFANPDCADAVPPKGAGLFSPVTVAGGAPHNDDFCARLLVAPNPEGAPKTEG